MAIELTQTENSQSFDVEMKGTNINGEISNKTVSGMFEYKPDEFEGFLRASELRAIADELDRLNKIGDVDS